MLKSPARSKRRLAEALGERAAEAAGHLAACALEDVAGWAGPRWVSPAAKADLEWLRGRLGPREQIVMQRGGNLGERINQVSNELFIAGERSQIFIGIDCPSLDLAYLRQAAAALRGSDAVLGPALDGGVVLMATRHPWPDLSVLPWSGSGLMNGLRTLCEAAGWRVALLAPRADVDTLSDLLELERGLGDDTRPARLALRCWLAELVQQRGHQ